MTALWLDRKLVKVLTEHALSGQPNEICGLLCGPANQATQAIPIRNIAPSLQYQFEMDPQEFIRALAIINTSGQKLLGIYHSHPTSAPIPSPVDVRYANYPDTPYLIIGLGDDEPRLAAWNITRDKQVDKLDIHIGLTAPETPLEAQTLNTAQKTAILGSILIAFTLIIMISLALLPPAPPIP